MKQATGRRLRPAPSIRAASDASLRKYAEQAVKLGAKCARVVPTSSVVTGAWVRLKCQFGCSGYGQCLTCPPWSPTPEQTAAALRSYTQALLIRGDRHADVTTIAVELERLAFLDGHYKAFAFGAGPCSLCRACRLRVGECRRPQSARPSMEASGIDVYQTARNNDMPIAVVSSSGCAQNYYALLLIR